MYLIKDSFLKPNSLLKSKYFIYHKILILIKIMKWKRKTIPIKDELNKSEGHKNIHKYRVKTYIIKETENLCEIEAKAFFKKMIITLCNQIVPAVN